MNNTEEKISGVDVKKVMEQVDRATPVRDMLEAMSNGSLIRNVISMFIRILAIVIGFAALVVWIRCWGFIGMAGFWGGVAVFLWQLVFPVAAFVSLKVVYLRGVDIRDMPDSRFTVAPIVANLIAMKGEAAFAFLAIMSVPAMFLAWFAVSPLGQICPMIGSGFWAGPATFVAFWVWGFVFMLVTRAIQEWTLAIFSIASDVSVLVYGPDDSDEMFESEDAGEMSGRNKSVVVEAVEVVEKVAEKSSAKPTEKKKPVTKAKAASAPQKTAKASTSPKKKTPPAKAPKPAKEEKPSSETPAQ